MAEIKIIENDRREQFVAAAGQTIFPFDFPIFDADEIAVFRTRAGVDAKLTLDADYTVTGVGDEAGGNVVLTAGAAEGDVITIQGEMPRARTTDFQEGGDFRAVVINRELDRLQVQIQELSRITSRKVGLLDTDTTEVALLPRKADRALRYLAFDADGRPIAAEGTGDPTPITPFAATLLDDVDAAAARATLGAAGVDAENVFEKTQRFQTSDDSSSAGPIIIIARLSKSPAINDFLGQIRFIGQDENGEEQIYAMLSPFIANPAAGAHAGALRILIPAAGTLAERLRIGAGVVLGSGITGGDRGAGTLNAADLYINGTSVLPGLVKASARINISSGTPSVAAGALNVASVIDNGVGDFTINWATPFSSPSAYQAFAIAIDASGGDMTMVSITSQTAGSVRIGCYKQAGTPAAVDPAGVNIMAVGALAG